MKKTLIAIAALVATGAFAQSTVTLSGSLDAGVASTTVKGNSGFGYISNLTSTSGFGMNVTNDLGGGMTAYGKFWSDLQPTSSLGGSSNGGTSATNNALGNSENKVGLRGAFGDIAFGAINDIGLESHLTATSFGTAIGSGTSITSRMNAANKARSDNTIAYNSPRWNGVSVGYVGRKQQTGGSTVAGSQQQGVVGTMGAAESTVSQVALRYNAGPINVIFSQVADNAWNVGGAKDVITNLAGNYTFGATTVYAGIQGTVKQQTALASALDSTRSAFTIGAKYVTGMHTVMGTMARVSESNTLNATNAKAAKNLGLGYEYALSKQTSVVTRYDRTTDDIGFVTAIPGTTTTPGNNDRGRLALGLRVAF